MTTSRSATPAPPAAPAAPTLFDWSWPLRWPAPQPGGAASPWFNWAPAQLSQPLNPGWSFGNVTVNTSNSSAPEVERDIVSRHSYGRQIGRLMDAMRVVVQTLPAAQRDDPCINALVLLCKDLADIKQAGREARLARLRDELQALKQEDPAAWRGLLATAAQGGG